MCLKQARLLVLTKVPSFDQKDQPQSVTKYLLLQLGAPGKNYTFLTEDKDLFILHDVIKWERFPRYWPFVRGIHRSPVNSPHKDQWRRDLMFSLICAWIGSWVNNREAGDLRRHRTHYDSHCNIHSQYHSCWWSGDVRSQSISSYDTDLPVVLLEYFSFNTRTVDPLPSIAVMRAQFLLPSPTANGSLPTTGRKLSLWKQPTLLKLNEEISRSAASWPTLPTDTAGWKISSRWEVLHVLIWQQKQII